MGQHPIFATVDESCISPSSSPLASRRSHWRRMPPAVGFEGIIGHLEARPMPGWISSTTSIASRPTESASLSRAFTCKVTLSAPTSPAPIILQITSPFVGASNPRLGQSGAAHGGASALDELVRESGRRPRLVRQDSTAAQSDEPPIILRDPLERIVAVVDEECRHLGTER